MRIYRSVRLKEIMENMRLPGYMTLRKPRDPFLRNKFAQFFITCYHGILVSVIERIHRSKHVFLSLSFQILFTCQIVFERPLKEVKEK